MTETEKTNLNSKITEIIEFYNSSIEELLDEKNPGLIRSKKGFLVEELTRRIVKIAWVDYLLQDKNRLKQDKKKKAIRMFDVNNYYQRYNNDSSLDIIKSKRSSIKYDFGTDDHIFIDNNFVLAIECKAYTESAMLKRIIYDRKLLHEFSPNTKYILLQFESALGGDFELCSKSIFGSNQYHVFMSREETNIEVITLLEGRRSSERPIHRREHRKALKAEHVLYAIKVIAKTLESYCN